ncbi:MAG: hypothetical protein J7K89_09590 [Candidatus Cloacimonetes bacterium]|nr:hypothetical protein [Candidatus Cloacimonadota bacterium]
MQRRIVWLSYFGLLLAIAAPYLILGHDAHILVHDNLNQINMLGIHGGRFAAPLLPGSHQPHFTLQGTPDIFHLAHFKLDKPLFALGYFPGFVLNELLYRLLALLGMAALLRCLNGTFGYPQLLATLAFAALPFWPQGNGSIAAFPLLAVACIHLSRHHHLLPSLVLIAFYALYSNFFFIGIYLVPLWLAAILWLLFRGRKPWPLLAGCILFLALSAISHFPVFYNQLVAHIPTNRAVQEFAGVSTWQSAKAVVMNILASQPLAPSLHRWIILPFCVVITILLWRNKARMRSVGLLWLGIISCATLSALFFWMPIQRLWQALGLGFNFSRIYVFMPMFWYLLLAFCAGWLSSRPRKVWKTLAITILSAQLLLNLGITVHRTIADRPTFRQFVAIRQFDAIKTAMGTDAHQDVVGCIGFYPAVAQYNGLRTIDSFSAYYPASYKATFRSFIAAELEGNQELRTYFENRGSALYLFDDEIGFDYTTQNYPADLSITCDLNIPALQQHRVKWLIASVPIKNAAQRKLQPVITQPGNGYYRSLTLYRIKEEL